MADVVTDVKTDGSQHQEEPTVEQLQEKLTKAEEIKGNLDKALKEERGQRQGASAKIAELTEEINYIKGQLDTQGKAGAVTTELEDDDPVDVGMLKKVTSAIRKELDGVLEKQQIGIQQIKVADSEYRTRERYKDAPSGLTFDEILPKGLELLEKDESLKVSVQRAKDPAARLYQIACTHPDVKKILDEIKTTELVDKIKDPKFNLPAGAGAKGSSKDLSVTEILALPDEKRKALMRGD